ncbi:putative sulfate exporter family transporter [Skermania sp. ID1734]|uniref:YeiH family protein n=1 Tax=Skermania sp. ID1734 TaxID=2597516 RepID=UPI00118061BA|nr:putative sulfate exporter family transporter [Skermania sp. ID1734]TSD99945.1 putative sulfate exporter family transporter [Skermania sp. ID1734]
MSTTASTIATRPAASRQRSIRLRRALPGALLALAVAAVATVVGRLVPVLGAPVAGVLLGVIVAAVARPAHRRPALTVGFSLTGGLALQVAVVLLGTQLSLAKAWEVGQSALPVMAGTLIACFLAVKLLGRRIGVDGDLRTLIGVGTAICGASAIAAVTPVLKPKPATIAYALSTIFFFNIAAVLVFPVLGHMIGMGQHAFGVFAGTAVNDTSSVVAAAAAYGTDATQTAVVVKLTRALMIIPVVLVVAALAARRQRAEGGTTQTRPGILRLVPWFLVGFVAMATLNSVAPLPLGVHNVLSTASLFLITWALAAIGLSTDLRALRRTGWTPLLFGASLWIVVSATSLGIQALTTGLG